MLIDSPHDRYYNYCKTVVVMREMETNMKLYIRLLVAVMIAAMTQVTAFATANPSTGDNSMVALVVGVMAAAAVVLVVVLLLTRNKK